MEQHSPPPPPSGLTPKQQRFVAEYLVDLNATAAAIRAGYSHRGASTAGERMLRNVEIATAIREGRARQLEALDLDAQRVLRELLAIATSDLGDAFDEAGNLRDVHSLPARFRPAVAGIEVVKRNLTSGAAASDVVHKVRLWDKVRALELLMKHLQLLDPEGGPPMQVEQLVLRIEPAPANQA
jgi:phage terminase small subunit